MLVCSRFLRKVFVAACLAITLLVAEIGVGQQVAIQTPATGVNESFFESIGTTWAVRGKNWFASFGMPPLMMPGTGIAGGVHFSANDVSGSCFGWWQQGFDRSLVGWTPTLTLTNGLPGYIGYGAVRPFVIGFVPIVGQWTASPAPPSPPKTIARQVLEGNVLLPPRRVQHSSGTSTADGQPAVQSDSQTRPRDFTSATGVTFPSRSTGRSTAELPAPSVAEARAAFLAKQRQADARAEQLLEKARKAQASGRLHAAQTYCRMAYREAGSDTMRKQITDLLEKLGGRLR